MSAVVDTDSATGKTTQTFLSAFVTNGALLGIQVVAFILLKNKLSRIYTPRTFLPPPDKRADDLPNGPVKWLFKVWQTPLEDVIRKNGLDAYMLLRFLKLMMIIFGSFTVITWVVLLPVDTAGIDNKAADGLNKLSWGNIPSDKTERYIAHIVLAYILTFFTLYLIRLEFINYTHLRLAYLTAPSYSHLPQSRTVLITSIPHEMCEEKKLRVWASFVPGGVQQIWVYGETKELNHAYTERDELCAKLEAVTCTVLRDAVKAQHKLDKEAEKNESTNEKRGRRRTDLDSDLPTSIRQYPSSQSQYPPAPYPPYPPTPSSGSYPPSSPYPPNSAAPFLTYPTHQFPQPISPPVAYRRPSLLGHDLPTLTPLPPSPSSNIQGLTSPYATSTLEIELESRYPYDVDVNVDTDAVDNASISSEQVAREREMLDRLVPPDARPKHRVGKWGLLGHKVDSISYYQARIKALNHKIHLLRVELKRGDKNPKPLGSAFIQCNLQIGAHVLAQCVSYHEPMKMANKWIQVAPKDVIWENIDDGVYETRFRYVTSWLLSLGLIAAWFFPVTFVGLLSNITKLCVKVKWLAWICSAPTPVPGIIQGILPPLVLAILFAILPWILRGLAWYENLPLYSLLSISVYKRYFLFLVIHGFLVVTLSSGITATLNNIISSPTKTVSELASHLPDASIFFLTWTITRGLTGAGGALLQIFTLLMYYLKKWFIGRTPRQAYDVTFMMPRADFGTVLPQLSLLATIGLAYSVLSPIINGLALLAFALFYFVWKFLLTWVFDQSDEQETGGLYFPIAMQYLFVGLYIEQFCLMALFFLKTSSSDKSFLVQGILMIVLMVITLATQLFLKQAFDPVSHYLPMSLATEHLQKKMERRWKKNHGEKVDVEFDLFNREHLHAVFRRRIKNTKQAIASDAKAIGSEVKTGLSKLKQPLNTLLDPIASAVKRQSNESSRAKEEKDAESRPRRSSDVSISLVRTNTKESHKSSRPIFDPPAPAPSPHSDLFIVDPDDSGDDSDFDENGFEHPSRYKPQPWIWIPRDPFGMSKVFVKQFRSEGIDSSDGGSTVDRGGVVEVTRAPPEEAWAGGHDA